MKVFLGYLLIVNCITYIVFAIDKRRAVRGKWRIPESTLFGLALLGGSIGGMLAMQICRHKTKHWSFRLGLPMILLMQVIAFCFVRKLMLK